MRQVIARIGVNVLITVVAIPVLLTIIKIDPWLIVCVSTFAATLIWLWGMEPRPEHTWRKRMWPIIAMALGGVIFAAGAGWYYRDHRSKPKMVTAPAPAAAVPMVPARIIVERMEVKPDPESPKKSIIRLFMKNVSGAPGYMPTAVVGVHTEEPLPDAEIASRMEKVMRMARTTNPTKSDTMEPGQVAALDVGQDNIPYEHWEKVRKRQMTAYVWTALVYRDETTKPDEAWVSRFGMAFEHGMDEVRNLPRATQRVKLNPPAAASSPR